MYNINNITISGKLKKEANRGNGVVFRKLLYYAKTKGSEEINIFNYFSLKAFGFVGDMLAELPAETAVVVAGKLDEHRKEGEKHSNVSIVVSSFFVVENNKKDDGEIKKTYKKNNEVDNDEVPF